jgi:hypothetical protein
MFPTWPTARLARPRTIIGTATALAPAEASPAAPWLAAAPE